MYILCVYCLKNMFVLLKYQFFYFCLVLFYFNGSFFMIDNNLKWRDGMNCCKLSGVYFIGKINLINIVLVC